MLARIRFMECPRLFAGIALLSIIALSGLCFPFSEAQQGFAQEAAKAGAQDAPVSTLRPTLRVATFNVALNRKAAGELAKELEKGEGQASKIAAIIREVSPDILLVNELDYDERTAELFLSRHLNGPDTSNQKTGWKYYYAGPVNTGVDSGLDLDGNGKLHEPNDAWGFGAYPGQYGMAVYSRYPIQVEGIRTFQKFLWSAMPGALEPRIPDNGGKPGKSYYSEATWKSLRLSSKSHWDIPILIGDRTVHVIASHPTPPVFDGPEDRNGRRNHDEIRMLKDYVAGDASGDYLLDDQGTRGGLKKDSYFVILGDLNADPLDGDGMTNAVQELLAHPSVAKYPAPASKGGVAASKRSEGANLKHRGNPANDTGDFNDKNPGNLRVDFVLPSANMRVVRSGVYWPTAEESPSASELVEASDHRLVWVDIEF